MSVIVLLDAGPLGMVTNPKATALTLECTAWLRSLLLKGIKVAVPEISDYEVRRELLRADKSAGLARLNGLCESLMYLPLNTETIRQAAEFWAEARQRGQPTARDAALDGDVILAAQAAVVMRGGDASVIATTNVKHLDQFVDAREWRDIT